MKSASKPLLISVLTLTIAGFSGLASPKGDLSLWNSQPTGGWRFFGHGLLVASADQDQREILIDINWTESNWGVGGMFTLDRPLNTGKPASVEVEVRTVSGTDTGVFGGLATTDDANIVLGKSAAIPITTDWQTITLPVTSMKPERPDINSKNFNHNDWARIQVVKLLFAKPDNRAHAYDMILIRNPRLVMDVGPVTKQLVELPQAVVAETPPRAEETSIESQSVTTVAESEPTDDVESSFSLMKYFRKFSARGSADQDDEEEDSAVEAPALEVAITSTDDRDEAPSESVENYPARDSEVAHDPEIEPFDLLGYLGRYLPRYNVVDHWDMAHEAFAEREAVDGAQFEFHVNYIYDHSTVLKGGLRQTSAGRGWLSVNILSDLEQIFGIPDTTVYADFQVLHGEQGFKDSGDFQWYSNIDDEEFSSLQELWLETEFFDGRLRLKLGKVEPSSEFAVVNNGYDFLSSSGTLDPTIFVLPTWPETATSVNVFIQPNDKYYVGFGLYDGALVEGKRTGSRGPDSFFNEPADLFMIGEVGTYWDLQDDLFPGEGRIGVWHHNGEFYRFDGGRDTETTGAYIILEQRLWNWSEAENNSRRIDAYLKYGQADGDVSDFRGDIGGLDRHIGAGLVYNSPFQRRAHDALGIAVHRVEFTDATNAGFDDNHESAYEVFYKLQLAEQFIVKPDLQYIVNPGGDRTIGNATILTLRFEFEF